jgi:energy-converting hydrogenase B subunit D
MNIIYFIIMGFLMVSAAIAALYLKDLSAAVIASGAVSLLASILFLMLGAPDVAMTEAAIGSALTTVVFLYALSRMRGRGKEEPRD